ncbi:MAG: cis-L-3-hydroxyproline dehydratase [Hyphomicrobiales bacterium]
MFPATMNGRTLVHGDAQGEVLFAEVGLSFWGGVDAGTGRIIDGHHPLCGAGLAGKVLAIPSGRGSCSGSGVLLELILNGHAPAALVFGTQEDILPLAIIIAEEVFGLSLPAVGLSADDFRRLGSVTRVRVNGPAVMAIDPARDTAPAALADEAASQAGVALDEIDKTMLAGECGAAAQLAMRIVLRMAGLLRAQRLIDVSQAHIDGCIYTGPGGLRFAERLVELGARVRIPTTLNAVSVDRRRWRALGVDAAIGEPASRLGDAYLKMGAAPSFTCAPYLLDTAPAFGAQIVWAESNAVVYANSVLGARTLKYPDFLDICIALTGRAPLAGCHLDAGRVASVVIELPPIENADESLYPLLGYHVGGLAPSEIPLIVGLERAALTVDDLKAFGAAFATTSAAPMFHVAGVTPEAPPDAGLRNASRRITVTKADLLASWDELNSANDNRVGLVAIGSPHASLAELARLAALCGGRKKHHDTALVVTCGRAVYQQASEAGYVGALEAFGAQLLTDTCWCMLGEPIVPRDARTVMTNSGKYAHYAPALVGRPARFGSLSDCVDAACDGHVAGSVPGWLGGRPAAVG